MNIHYIYYNGGLAALPEVRAHLRQYPDGNLMQLLQKMINIREDRGDYSQKTLNRIYGIGE